MAAEIVGRGYMSAFHCGSWHGGDGQWSQGVACRDRCEQVRAQHEQTIDVLHARIADAIDKAQRAIRFGLEPNSSVVCVFARDMDAVIEILEGKA
jgi:hypothetical protein